MEENYIIPFISRMLSALYRSSFTTLSSECKSCIKILYMYFLWTKIMRLRCFKPAQRGKSSFKLLYSTFVLHKSQLLIKNLLMIRLLLVEKYKGLIKMDELGIELALSELPRPRLSCLFQSSYFQKGTWMGLR